MQCWLANMHPNQWKILHLPRTAEVDMQECNKNEPSSIFPLKLALIQTYYSIVPGSPAPGEGLLPASATK